MKVQMVKIELGDGSSVIGAIPALPRQPVDDKDVHVTFSETSELSDTWTLFAVLQRIAAHAVLSVAP